MKQVTTMEKMRAADNETIAMGTSAEKLMLRAGYALYENLPIQKDKIAIVCGKGNNGGDGIALACILSYYGYGAHLYLTEVPQGSLPAFYLDALQNGRFDFMADYPIGADVRGEIIKLEISSATDFSSYSVIVDCLLGTGTRGTPSAFYSEIIEQINVNSKAFILSCDIPSGINGDSGQGSVFVLADKTVTIGAVKVGLLLQEGKATCGEVVTADIGIQLKNDGLFWVESKDLCNVFQRRNCNTAKWDYGTACIIGGSAHYVGAPYLALLGAAALRSGAGLTRIAVPSSLAEAISGRVTECTLFPLAHVDGNMTFDVDEISQLLKGVSAVAVGMGWGNGADNKHILDYLSHTNLPLVLDADALKLFSHAVGLHGRKAPVILTPHVFEFARLSGIPSMQILTNPVYYAKSFAEKYGVTLLLKGAGTIITDGKTVLVSTEGTPAQAKGGSGDLLSGIICGLLSRGVDALHSAACGAFLAGSAALIAEKDFGQHSLLPSDTASYIPKALAACGCF